MAITSKGYTGSLNNVDWSVVVDKAGAQFAVFGNDAFALSTAVGDRAVTVKIGEASGQGIRDISDEDVTLSAPAVTSGDRWDMVALRRNWTNKTTSLVIVPGSSVKALPATRERTVGAKVDHPLWLIRSSAGQNVIQERIDLRVWHGDGGVLARDLLVREFMDRPGTVIRIGEDEWARLFDAEKQAVWRRVSGPPQGGWTEALTGGAIAQSNATTPLILITVPRLIPTGALLHISAELEIYIPEGENYAGYVQILRGANNPALLVQRRWHNQKRNRRYMYPSVELNLAVTEDMPAGTQFRFSINCDPLSAGPIELWHAFVSWSVS